MNKYLLFTFVLSFITVVNAQVQEISLVSRMDGSKTLTDGTDVEFWGYGEDDPMNPNDKIFLPGPVLR